MGCNSKFNKYTKSLNEKTELSFWEWGSHSDEYETVFWDMADIDRYFSGMPLLSGRSPEPVALHPEDTLL